MRPALSRTLMGAGSLMNVLGALLLGLVLAPAALAAEIIIDNGQAGFAVTGEWPVSTVVAGYHGANYQFAPPGDVPGGTVVDNTDPGTSAVGTWTAGTGVAGFWGANYQSHPAGSGSESFTWPLTIPAAGSYKVFARWSASANRTNVARYTVNHAGGAAVVMVNQQGDGGQWNLLGTFTFNAGNTTVRLSDQANGVVIADAVKFVAASAAPSSAQWTVATAGQYQLYARWSAYPNRATNAPYTVTHAGGTTALSVNQQQNGGQWNLLGTYTFTAGQTVTLTSQANGHVIADAIRLVSGAPQAQTMYFVHTDHLNTPRLITNNAGQAVWRWDQADPFGGNVPNENPSGLGTFTCNLRLPGQYFDKETNLHYNYFRDYDPGIGQYVQSDPIGLNGGLNTYAYSYSNPLSWSDGFGLAPSNSQKCRSLAKKIENLEKDIDKRVTDISTNPRGLPLLPPYPGAPNRASVSGHQKIIDDLRDVLARRKKQYQEECCNDCDGGGGGAPATSTNMSTPAAVGVGVAGAACIAVCVLQPQFCPLIVIGGAAAGAAAR